MLWNRSIHSWAAAEKASRGHRRGARQRDDGLEAGAIVLELELAAVQPRDRGGQAQPQSRARFGTALLQPHEALDRAAAIGLGNTAAAVGDGQENPVALAHRLDHD